MSTGIESWGGNILDIGPIYPFVGSEAVLVIVGVALWILWHVWQARHESQEYADEISSHGKPENYKKMAGEGL